MLSRCLFCHQPLPPNDVLEFFPIGQRIAYDTERGRLWCICEGCRRWTLAPFEQRWEALEEIERLANDRARLLYQGENIALLQLGKLELVRVGRAGLREEAWWRYGRQLEKRYCDARKIVDRGRIMYVAWLALLGIPLFGAWEGTLWIDRARRLRFGRKAWSGWAQCTGCGSPIGELMFDDRVTIRMVVGDGVLPGIDLPCPYCGRGSARLRGAPAVHTLRRVLAFHNFAGADERGIKDAVGRIEAAGSPGRLVTQCIEQTIPVLKLPASATLGLEIALNEENERMLLALDLAALEARWREEETIAAIADRELTPLPRS